MSLPPQQPAWLETVQSNLLSSPLWATLSSQVRNSILSTLSNENLKFKDLSEVEREIIVLQAWNNIVAEEGKVDSGQGQGQGQGLVKKFRSAVSSAVDSEITYEVRRLEGEARENARLSAMASSSGNEDEGLEGTASSSSQRRIAIDGDDNSDTTVNRLPSTSSRSPRSQPLKNTPNQPPQPQKKETLQSLSLQALFYLLTTTLPPPLSPPLTRVLLGQSLPSDLRPLAYGHVLNGGLGARSSEGNGVGRIFVKAFEGKRVETISSQEVGITRRVGEILGNDDAWKTWFSTPKSTLQTNTETKLNKRQILNITKTALSYHHALSSRNSGGRRNSGEKVHDCYYLWMIPLVKVALCSVSFEDRMRIIERLPVNVNLSQSVILIDKNKDDLEYKRNLIVKKNEYLEFVLTRHLVECFESLTSSETTELSLLTTLKTLDGEIEREEKDKTRIKRNEIKGPACFVPFLTNLPIKLKGYCLQEDFINRETNSSLILPLWSYRLCDLLKEDIELWTFLVKLGWEEANGVNLDYGDDDSSSSSSPPPKNKSTSSSSSSTLKFKFNVTTLTSNLQNFYILSILSHNLLTLLIPSLPPQTTLYLYDTALLSTFPQVYPRALAVILMMVRERLMLVRSVKDVREVLGDDDGGVMGSVSRELLMGEMERRGVFRLIREEI